MNIKVTGARVVVEIEKKEEKTASGLLLAKTMDQGDVITGKVVAAGPGRTAENGQVIKNSVNEGDRVMFQYGTNVILDGKSYLLVNESDVLIIL